MYNFSEIRQSEWEKYGISFPDEIDRIRQSFFDSNQCIESESFYYSLGGAVCGPIFTAFCEWAVDVAVKENIKLIFPLMREGELYSKLLDAIISLRNLNIRVKPLYVSRSSSYYALCYNEFNREFFNEIAFSSPCSIRNCFYKLGLNGNSDIFEDNEEGINKSIRLKRYEAVDEVYNEIIERGLSGQINERIDSAKPLLHEYLIQNGASESFITLDCGSMGTIPQSIDNCSLRNIKKIHLFLKARAAVKERIARGHDIRSLLNNYENESNIINLFFSNFAGHFFETITMGNTKTGTAIGYEKDKCGKVQVKCDKSIYNDSLRHAVDIIQSGILDFCIQYIKYKLNADAKYDVEYMLQCGLASFCRLVDSPMVEEVKNLGWFEYDDSVRKTSMKFVAQSRVNNNNTLLPFPEWDIDVTERDVSRWWQGSLLINTKLKEQNLVSATCRKIVVYGCGYWGKVVIEKILNYDMNIVCIVDQKQAGGVYLIYPIISIAELSAYDFDDVVIASADYAEEIGIIIKKFSLSYPKEFKIHSIIV